MTHVCATTTPAPEMIFVAAGQDGSQFAPNARQLLSMAGFRDLGARARTDDLCGGRLMLAQDGRCAVTYAAFCLYAALEGVLARAPALADPLAWMPKAPEDLDAASARIQAAHLAARSAA